ENRTPLELRNWECFVDLGGGFRSDLRDQLDPVSLHGRLRLELTLPAGTKRMRLDLPANMPLWIFDIGAEQFGRKVSDLAEIPRALADVEQPGSVLWSPGKPDPYIVWRLPFAIDQRTSVPLVLDAVPQPAAWVDAFVRSPAAAEVEAVLAEHGAA